MVFLHKKTCVTARVLVQNGSKSSYQDGQSVEGHLKPYSIDDVTFDVSGVSGTLFKFTFQGSIPLQNGEKLSIAGEKYKVSAVKRYTGITFNTMKVLLTLE